MSFTEHHYTAHDGLSLYYRNYPSRNGNTDTVLCLPGLTRNSRDFEDLAEHMAATYSVLCPDFRGRGQSDHDPNFRNYNPGVYVRDMWTLLDQLGIDRVAIVGTSLGGLMAMIMAAQQANRLSGVVLNDIGPAISPEGHARVLKYVGRHTPVSSWAEAEEQSRQAHSLAFPDQSADYWRIHARRCYVEDDSGVPVLDMDPMIGEAARKALGPIKVLRLLRRLGLIRQISGVFIDPWDSFCCMTMPCTVLRGELSDILSADTVARMQQVVPQLQEVVIPNRGHAPNLAEPEALAAIDALLAEARWS